MRDRGKLYVGILLILFGGIFLLAQLGESMFRALGLALGWSRMWPLLVLFAGLAFLLPILVWWERRQEIVGLAMPGAIITMNGLLLLYQNTTGDWGSWSYLWTMELIAVALGLFLIYVLGPRAPGLLVATGIVGGIGLVFLMIFAAAFGGGIFRFLAPVVLIAIGALVILFGVRRSGSFPEE